ncbi:MAG: FtsK/SpoIIIE domain-containing protein, partial [Leucobacter sp.]
MTLELPRGGGRDITLSCDVTTTVADTARALIRAGVCGDPEIEEIARGRIAPVTLRGRASATSAIRLLDPGSPIAASGLQSGWLIEPVLEFGGHGTGERLVEVAAYAEVLSGRHAGVVYSLVAGANLIGRDRGCRVHLNDASVSRRHAVVEITAGEPGTGRASLVLRDLGSANGVRVDGRAVSELRFDEPSRVTLGGVDLRIVPGPSITGEPLRPSQRVLHIRSPRVAPSFPASERELPAPPAPTPHGRIPVLALLAPMLMGGAMYAITGSPMSLMMAAFSPLMMIGSWLDGRAGGKRRLSRELRRFEEGMSAERVELSELRAREIATRAGETPELVEIAAAVIERGALLWTRRPEHRSFLEVRFGEGSLPSRTALVLPPRGDIEREPWEMLRDLAGEFGEIAPVPVLERLDRCGSIGIAGERLWAEGMARSIVLQLVGLHSPAELALACFAGTGQVAEWSWLKWLPHVGAVTGPIPVPQLADTSEGATRLLIALEELIECRLSGAGSRGSARSHLDPSERNDADQGEAVRELPITPAVVVLVLDGSRADPSRLIALAEQGPDAGVHLVWVGRERALLPATCRTFVELDRAHGSVGFVRSGTTVPLIRPEFVEAPEAIELARRLSPVEDAASRVLDESDLPKAVQLRELHGIDLLGGGRPIVQSWEASGTLVSQWRPGMEREPVSLAAVVGQGADGIATIDLRSHGPHALVGGTTGAGKSEFLQTWIMSMAARVSPDRLTFLLVDYKGGAAFAECIDLPHAVGLVTDLGPHLVRRALASLRAELRHREELLARHGAKDLVAMERRSDPAAPPALVIVIDEFAALATEVPEFVDGVIDIAQRGRSLGLHLIMATQRPAGVIKDNLRANTNLRIALRMADESDSIDVVGVRDAAFFDADTPGRGAVKIGPGRIDHFQTGYLGGRASAAAPGSRIAIRSLEFAEGEPWTIPPEHRPFRSARAEPPRDIEALRDGIVEAARIAGVSPPRRPWLDALPRLLRLDEIGALAVDADLAGEDERADAGDPAVGAGSKGDAVAIGLRDEPASQARRPVRIDLEDVGNVAFVGASGTGKTSALITLAASLSAGTVALPVHLYAIDAAGGALGALAALPTVGAVAPLSDPELTGRVLRHVLALIAERGPRYAAARAGGLAAFRRRPEGRLEPRIVLMIDGFAAFRQATEALGGSESPLQQLSEIMMTGRAVGVHVVLTADRPASVPAAMSSSLQRQFVLRLANPHDYGYLGVKGDALEEAPPGRALIAGAPEEIQLALLGGEPELAGQASALEELAASLRERRVSRAVEVRNAPGIVPLDDLPAESGGRPVYGIDTRGFEPVSMPTSGIAVISGPAGSGQSTAALACVRALERCAAARGERVEKILLTFAAEGLGAFGAWDRAAQGEEQVRELAGELVIALGGRPVRVPGGLPGEGAGIGGPIGGGPIGGGEEGSIGLVGDSGIAADPVRAEAPRGEAGTESPRVVFPSPGKRGVIVVERSADAEGTEAMP